MKQSRWFYQPATVRLAMAAIVSVIATQSALPQTPSTDAKTEITVPAGARVVFAVVRPVASKSVSAGETVYLQTTFPVLVGDKLAIPAGTFVQGILTDVPVRSKHEIELPMKSVVMIFGEGTAVTASGAVKATINRDKDSSVLDVGAPGQLVLPEPVVVEEKKVAEALHHPRRLLAVHDLIAASRPAQNPAGTCYTPEIPPKPEIVTVGSYTIDTQTIVYTTSTPAVPAKPGTPYPCP